MNGVRVYMRAGWSKTSGNYSVGPHLEESGDVTILEYEDAHYDVNGIGWLRVCRVDDGIAAFPPGDWAGVERFQEEDECC